MLDTFNKSFDLYVKYIYSVLTTVAIVQMVLAVEVAPWVTHAGSLVA